MDYDELNKRLNAAIDAEQVVIDLLAEHFPDIYNPWADKGGDAKYNQEDTLGPLAEILSELPYGDPNTGVVWGAVLKALPIMLAFSYPAVETAVPPPSLQQRLEMITLETAASAVERALRLGAKMVSAEHADAHGDGDEDYGVDAVFNTLAERFVAEHGLLQTTSTGLRDEDALLEAWNYDVQSLWCIVRDSVSEEVWEDVEDSLDCQDSDVYFVGRLRSLLWHHAPGALPEFDELAQTAGA